MRNTYQDIYKLLKEKEGNERNAELFIDQQKIIHEPHSDNEFECPEEVLKHLNLNVRM
jgi:hypothetical protein